VGKTVSVKLRLEVGGYVLGAKQAEAAAGRIGDALDKTSKKGKADLDKIARGLGIAGTALVGLAAVAVTTAAAFDKQMSEVGAVANATAEQLLALREAAIQAGQATVFSASDAARAEAELAKAGVSTADILKGALAGSLSLASAGSLDLATSATIAANAMNTFGLGGDQVGHIADVLAAAANKSAAGVDDLGQGLQQVGLVANQFGLSFEETVALLGAFADRGLRGSDGATSLKTALQRLGAPTEEAASQMKALGLSFYDGTGQMKDIVEVAGDLQTALKDLSPAQRNAALQTIFGSDAIRAANILYTEGSKGIQDYVDAVNDQGAASRVAAQKMDNLAGDVEQLKGSLETLFITSGEGANGGLRTLAQGLTGLVNTFSGLPGSVQSTVVVVAGLTGGALLLAAAGIKVKTTLASVNEQLVLMGPAGAKAAAGLAAVGKFGGIAVGAITALTLATDAANSLDDYSVSADGLADSLKQLGDTGKATGEITTQFGVNLDGFGKAVAGLSNPFGGLLGSLESVIPGLRQFDQNLAFGSPQVFKEQVAAVDAALTKLVQDGQVDAANAAFKRLWVEAQKSGVTLDELQAAFPNYIAASRDAAKSTATLADNTAAAARATLGAAQAGEKLIDVWDQLHGAVKSADETMLDAKKAVDDVRDAFAQNGRSIKGNTEAALENRIALENAARKASAAADAYLEAGGTADGARKILKDFEDQAIKATGATGKNADAVKALADQLFALPSNTTTTVTTIQRTVVGEFRAGERRWGGITTHAATGALREAAVYSSQSPARYAFAEPATGGEAFIPRNGDSSRSMSILHAAAGWYNADVVPKQGWYGSSGGQVAGAVDVRVRVEDPRGRVLHDTLTTYAVNTGRAPADLWSAKRR
jgi:TP901 family phage tail tape measure protein